MGFSISWIGFNNTEKSNVLELLSMTDTGSPDPGNRARFSLAVSENGSIILFSNDYDFASGDRLRALSSTCTLVACQIEEHVMASSTCAWTNGTEQWRIEHESDRGIYDLRVTGELPAEFAPILDSARAEQDANRGQDSDTDFVFDGPLKVAEAICAYKHDETDLEFSKLKSANASTWWPWGKKS